MKTLLTTLLLLAGLFLFALPTQAQEDETDPTDTEFIEADSQPEAVNLDKIKKKMKYPDKMRAAGIMGTVYIKILVNTNGKMKTYKIAKSPHKDFTDAVLPIINDIKFKPAMKDGKPIKMWVTIPFLFSLKGVKKKDK